MSTKPPLSYAPTIRAEIEKDVVELKSLFTANREGRMVWVRLGYLINTHRGQVLFAPGDELAGLKVKIDMDNPWVIMVGGPDDVEAIWR